MPLRSVVPVFNHLGRHTYRDSHIRNVFGYNRPSTYNGPFPYSHAIQDNDTNPQPHAVFNNDISCQQRLTPNGRVCCHPVIIGIKRAVRGYLYLLTNANGSFVSRKLATWLNMSIVANNYLAPRASLYGCVTVYMHASAKFNTTAASILVDEHPIPNKQVVT